MAAVTSTFEDALRGVRREPFSDLRIAGRVDQLCEQSGHVWRERLLTPLMTLRLFVLQVLNGNTAIAHLRQLTGIDFAPGSYCEARQRLPLEVICSLLSWLSELVDRSMETAVKTAVKTGRSIAQRVLIVDASSFSMSDTLPLRGHFGLPAGSGVIEGVSYPVAKLLGLLDLASGMFVQMLAAPLLKVSDQCGVVQLHAMLQTGDILLGDRAFGTYVHLALLNLRGVFACCRMHQRRKPKKNNGIDRWHRPAECPAWMKLAQFLLLPEWIDVRLVSYTIRRRGFRTKQVTLVTTLLDEQAWPDDRLAELYARRWEIETCFNHLKTTMKLNVLKCQNVQGVMKELAVYLLVYNLVRLVMLKAAASQHVDVRRVSFIDALRWLCCRMLGLAGVEALITNPARRGRQQPRVIRRRSKKYPLMKRPRSEWCATTNHTEKPE